MVNDGLEIEVLEYLFGSFIFKELLILFLMVCYNILMIFDDVEDRIVYVKVIVFFLLIVYEFFLIVILGKFIVKEK